MANETCELTPPESRVGCSTTDGRDGPTWSSSRAPLVALTLLAGLALYRFFHLALYPIYRGEFGVDFSVFYSAAQRYLLGQSLYEGLGSPSSYIYPPVLALLLAPLASVVESTPAFFAFATTAFLAVVGAAALLSVLARRDRLAVLALLGTTALGAWPVHLLLRQGQVDSITLILLASALVLAWRGRERPAALCLGLAISLKVTPGVLTFFFLWKRRYRLAVESVAVGALVVLLSGLLVGYDQLWTYTTHVLPRIGSEGSWYWYNQSLHALFLRLFTTTRYTQPVAELGLGVVTLASAIALGLLLALTLRLIPRRWPATPAVYLVQAGAFLLLETLGASLSWQMHAVWLLVPLGGLLLFVHEEPAVPRWLPLAVGLGSLGFIAGPYEPPLEYGRFSQGWQTILISHTVAADLLLLGLCLYAGRGPGRLASRQPVPSPARAAPAHDVSAPSAAAVHRPSATVAED